MQPPGTACYAVPGDMVLPSSSSIAAERRARTLDVFGTMLAVVLGLCSLPLPFGRDQGLYFYVAREWAKRGSIPYRDVFDHKPPGIYALHRLAIHLFGETQWGIRVLDLIAVLLSAQVVARLATPAPSPIPAGTRGVAALLVSVLFYGVLNYWDGPQSEIYYALLGAAGVCAALHVRNVRHAAAWAGVCAGAAMVVKPPVVWFVLLAMGLLALRARAERARGRLIVALCFAGAAALPIGATLVYFAAVRALPAMIDVVVGANGYYVAHEHAANPLAEAADGSQGYLAYYGAPAIGILAAGLVMLWLTSTDERLLARRNQYLLSFALVLAAYAAVAMQMKFYLLHWTPMVLALALLGTVLLRDLLTHVPESRVATCVPVFLIVGSWLGSQAGRTFFDQQVATVRYLSGLDSRERFTSRFVFPDIHFSYEEAEWVGRWLREHTEPSDFVAVRGFEPEVYAVAARRHSGRFFWTTFLTQPARAYRRAEYLAEDRGAFEGEARPLYFVARRERSVTEEGADSVAYGEGLGYRIELEHGRFVIMRDARR